MQGSGSSRQFRVSTEVDNEQLDGFWIIQPGTEARMVIDLNGQAAPRPTPPALKHSEIYSKVEALKPAERMVIDLLYLQGNSIEQVRELTGWSAALVKVRAFRARQKMKQQLAKVSREESR